MPGLRVEKPGPSEPQGSLAVSNQGVLKLSASDYWKSPLAAAANWQVPWAGPRAGPGRLGRPAAGWRDPAGSQVLDWTETPGDDWLLGPWERGRPSLRIVDMKS